jgi:hypothetical protein
LQPLGHGVTENWAKFSQKSTVVKLKAAGLAADKTRAAAEAACILIQADTADMIRTAHAAAARLDQTKAETVVASATLQAVKVEIGAGQCAGRSYRSIF